MKGFLLVTIFGPERLGITTEELWHQLKTRAESKIRDDDEPLTIMRLRDELETLRARGDIRSEIRDEDGEEVWLPVYSRSRREEMAAKQTALFE